LWMPAARNAATALLDRLISSSCCCTAVTYMQKGLPQRVRASTICLSYPACLHYYKKVPSMFHLCSKIDRRALRELCATKQLWNDKKCTASATKGRQETS
jgi:hypothetical protein